MTVIYNCEKGQKREAIQCQFIDNFVSWGMRLTGLIFCFAITACNGEIYVRDGVTDGDTFYLAEQALTNDDPVLQSWVSYSLARSTCQLRIGGENPARQSSFDCELSAREMLLDTWTDKQETDPTLSDDYLDDLASIHRTGFLDEYVARHYRRRHWQIPEDVNVGEYRRWQREHIPSHRPSTQIVGSWNYARNVGPK